MAKCNQLTPLLFKELINLRAANILVISDVASSVDCAVRSFQHISCQMCSGVLSGVN